MTNYITNNQALILKGCIRCYEQKNASLIVAPQGAGFEFASTNVLLRENPRLKLLYVNCIFSQGNKSLFVEVSSALSNIKISSLNYLRVDFDSLAKALWRRISADLKEDVLVILDNIDVLDLVGIKYLVSYLVNHKKMIGNKKPKCGILVRITSRRLSKIKSKNEFVYNALLAVFDDTKQINRYSAKEIKEFLTGHGMTDQALIDDIAQHPHNRILKKACRFIEKAAAISIPATDP
jgi:hypothetical protein